MTRVGIILLTLTAAMLAALVAPHRAGAISREQDIVRDLNEVFKAPSIFPPNPALRPNPDDIRNLNGNGTVDGERVLVPLAPDEGPGVEEPPEILPDRAYPFLVAIIDASRSPQEGFRCAGTLIATRWVLTAAHCMFPLVRRWPTNPDTAVLFDTTRLSQPGPKVAIRRIIPHPDYDPRTLKNDIALLQIDTGGRKFGTPLKLEGPPPQQLKGEIASVAGWGITNLTLAQRQRSEVQQLIQVIVRGDSCFVPSNYPHLKDSGNFCASSLYRHHDVCYRFGGGPLVLRDLQGERYLAGQVSWPAVCPPEVDKMNVYLDVQYFIPWIKSTIAANGGGG